MQTILSREELDQQLILLKEELFKLDIEKKSDKDNYAKLFASIENLILRDMLFKCMIESYSTAKPNKHWRECVKQIRFDALITLQTQLLLLDKPKSLALLTDALSLPIFTLSRTDFQTHGKTTAIKIIKHWMELYHKYTENTENLWQATYFCNKQPLQGYEGLRPTTISPRPKITATNQPTVCKPSSIYTRALAQLTLQSNAAQASATQSNKENELSSSNEEKLRAGEEPKVSNANPRSSSMGVTELLTTLGALAATPITGEQKEKSPPIASSGHK